MPRYPIDSVSAKSFGPFAEVAVDFSPALNVVVGDNGAGKSQLLKLLYAATVPLTSGDESLTKSALGRDIAARLVGVFRPDSLGRLTNRVQGRSRAELCVAFRGMTEPLEFSFASNSRSEVTVGKHPSRALEDTPVFLPTRELMSLYPGFVSLYNERQLEFDETWRDTADLLGRAPLRGPRSEDAATVLRPVEDILEGRVQESDGRFVLSRRGVGNIEMPLVAEGLRKLAMIVRLVQSGVLLQRGYLFWDEPEANLNPRSLHRVAQMIVTLARSGVQVFVATHSVFLLRELTLAHSSLPDEEAAGLMRVIALVRGESGVVARSASSVDDLPLDSLAALEAEIAQSERALGPDIVPSAPTPED